jgi:hypothetical protein
MWVMLICKEMVVSQNQEARTEQRREAVVKESLRLHTPNSMPMERVAPADFSVDGYIIPENTIVSIHPYNAHRDPDVYGEDAEAFRPERWLQADERSAKSMEGSFMAVSLYCICTESHWSYRLTIATSLERVDELVLAVSSRCYSCALLCQEYLRHWISSWHLKKKRFV